MIVGGLVLSWPHFVLFVVTLLPYIAPSAPDRCTVSRQQTEPPAVCMCVCVCVCVCMCVCVCVLAQGERRRSTVWWSRCCLSGPTELARIIYDAMGDVHGYQ